MANLTILVNGREHFSGDYNTLEIEETIEGNLSLSATFPPRSFDFDVPTGTFLDGVI